MIIIPERTKKEFIQTNRSNILGNILSTFGIDFQDNLAFGEVGRHGGGRWGFLVWQRAKLVSLL